MSHKNNDAKNRFRSKIIAFRVSPEEQKQLDIAVSLSGLTKQDYLISKMLDRTITVQGNCKIHRAVYDRLSEVLVELKKIKSSGCIDDELNSNITLILNLIDDLYEKNK